MIKEIYVEVKKSKNYQTYTAGETVVIDEGLSGPEVDVVRCGAFSRCREAVMEQIKKDEI